MPSAARSPADSFVLFSADCQHRRGALGDLDGIVLDPARLRQDLLVFELVAADLGAVVVEDHAAGAGGALVDRRDELGQRPAPLLMAAGRPSWTTCRVRSSTLTACPGAGRTHRASTGCCRPIAWSTSTATTSTRTSKRSVIRALEWTGECIRQRPRSSRSIALDEVADVPDPRILELGAGHGALSRKLLEWHPTAEVTVTDIELPSVAGHGRRRARRASPRNGARDGRDRDRRCRSALRPRGVRACRFTTCRRRWHRKCSPKAPGWPTSC